MAQVVDADILDAGTLADALPRWLKVGQVCAGVLPGDDPGVIVQPFDLGKDFNRRGADVDGLGPGLGVGEMERAVLEVHVVPLEGHDLGEPAAGEDQQAEGVDGRLALDAFLLALAQDLAEPGQFLLRKVALAFLLRVLLGVAAGIRAVWTQAPQFRQIEHLGKQLHAPVCLDRGVPQVVVKLGDVRSQDVPDLHRADAGIDVGLEVIAIADDRARLTVVGGVIQNDPPSQVLHGRRVARGVAGAGGVLAILDGGEGVDGLGARLLGRQDAMEPEAHAPGLAADAVLDHVGPFAAPKHAQPESRYVAVEDDIVLVSDLGRLDDAFGEFRHGAGAFSSYRFRLSRRGSR